MGKFFKSCFKLILVVCILYAIFLAVAVSALTGVFQVPRPIYQLLSNAPLANQVTEYFVVDSSVPRTDHGVFSVMTPIELVDNVLNYNEVLYEYMSETWPDDVEVTESFGRHLHPVVNIHTDISDYIDNNPDVFDGYGVVALATCHGRMSFVVDYDSETKEPISQSVGLNFCVEYNSMSHNAICDVVNTYFGVAPKCADVEQAISELALGDSSLEFCGCEMRISSHKYGHNDEPHIMAIVTYFNEIKLDE